MMSNVESMYVLLVDGYVINVIDDVDTAEHYFADHYNIQLWYLNEAKMWVSRFKTVYPDLDIEYKLRNRSCNGHIYQSHDWPIKQ